MIEDDIPLGTIDQAQSWIFDLNENSLNETIQKVAQSIFVQKELGLKILFHRIIIAFHIRPKQIRLYADFLGRIKNQLNENMQQKFKPYLESSLSTHMMHRYPFQKAPFAHFTFLLFLYKNNILELNFIIKNISSLIKAPYKMTRNRVSGLSYIPMYVCSFLCYFGKYLEKYNQTYYKELQNIIKNSDMCKNKYTLEGQLCDQYKSLKDNNWALWDAFFESDTPNKSITTILHDDDVQGLQEIMAKGNFDPDQIVSPSILEPAEILSNNPPLAAVAAMYNSVKIIMHLKLHGADFTKTDEAGNSILTFAIAGGSPEIIRLVDPQNHPPESLLAIAIEYHQPLIFDWLYLMYKDTEGFIKRRIDYAGSAASVNNIHAIRFMLAEGLNVSDVDSVGSTPLHHAAEMGNREAAAILLERPEIEVNKQDSKGWSPLHQAVINGQIPVVNLLLSRPDVNVNLPNFSGRTALHRAAREGHLKVLNSLLMRPEIDVNAVDKKMRSALHFAVLGNHPKCVRRLLEQKGVAPLLYDDSTQTPLHLAAYNDIPEVFEIYNEHGIDMNVADAQGWMPLHVAANQGSLKSVKVLTSIKSVDVNAVNGYGRTSLFYNGGNANITKTLLTRDDIDINIVDQGGASAMQIAIEEGNEEIAKIIESHK